MTCLLLFVAVSPLLAALVWARSGPCLGRRLQVAEYELTYAKANERHLRTRFRAVKDELDKAKAELEVRRRYDGRFEEHMAKLAAVMAKGDVCCGPGGDPALELQKVCGEFAIDGLARKEDLAARQKADDPVSLREWLTKLVPETREAPPRVPTDDEFRNVVSGRLKEDLKRLIKNGQISVGVKRNIRIPIPAAPETQS